MFFQIHYYPSSFGVALFPDSSPYRKLAGNHMAPLVAKVNWLLIPLGCNLLSGNYPNYKICAQHNLSELA